MEPVPLHGGQLKGISQRFGIQVSDLLDFSANINPEGPPESVLSHLRVSLDQPSTLSNYPDIDETELKQALARYAGVSQENIVVANGFAPILEAALRVLPIQRCLLPVPAFVEYRRTLDRVGIDVTAHPIPSRLNFRYDVQAMLTGFHNAILLANPQNPSGVLMSRDVLLELTTEAAARQIFVLFDEAFIDYSPEASLAIEVDRFPNLIVFRSLTKFFGMPGLRIAYAVTNPDLNRQLQQAISPWSITTLASLAAIVAVDEKPYVARTQTLNKVRRDELKSAVEELGIQVYPSSANFLLLRLPESGDHEKFWERMIMDHRIVLRNCANYEALGRGHLRAAVRKEQENNRLLEALAKTLASKANRTSGPGARGSN